MMIKDLGGEFGLIARLIGEAQQSSSVIVPNGDDSAVVRFGSELLAVSTDTFVEERHFSFRYFTPEQVGSKVIEAAASDIVAVGGKPQYLLIALSLPSTCEGELIEKVYCGINKSAERIHSEVLGGNVTAASSEIGITITVLGKVATEERLCTRKGAKAGDLIYVTGALGSSAAGLKVLQNRSAGYDIVKQAHLTPRCRIDIVDSISEFATSMIDISDGLSSELHHICRASGVGCIISEKDIPILEETRAVAKLFGESADSYAYNGGEDYELLYTISPKNRAQALGHQIGIISADKDLMRERQEERFALQAAGYDHFKK